MIEQLGKESRAGAVDRIATRRAKGAGAVAGNLINQINPAKVSIGDGSEIVARENRTRMRERMDFEGQAFRKPLLILRLLGIQLVAKNADGRAAINLFEALQNRAKKSFVRRGRPHVIHGENDDGFNARFANPLRRGETGELELDVKRIGIIEVGEAIGVSGEGTGG